MKRNLGAVIKGLQRLLIINKINIFLNDGRTISSVQIFGDFNIILKNLPSQTNKNHTVLIF